jgi:hypothetical protein
MIDMRRFTGQVFTVYEMYTLVSITITLMYTVMLGGMTFNVYNPKTGVVLCQSYVDGDELRVSLRPKADDHDNNHSLPDPRWMVETIVIGTPGYTETRDPQVTPSHVYRWGESTYQFDMLRHVQ